MMFALTKHMVRMATLLAVTLVIGQTVMAQVLPGGARPGAVAPERELRQPGVPDLDQVIKDAQTLPDEAIDPDLLESSDEFSIPTVADRPLDVEGGEKINVDRFELRGFSELPDIVFDEIEQIFQQQQQEYQHKFTIGHLQEVADLVTSYYRSRGFILAQAFIPVQTVDKGVVFVDILEGKLGRIQVEDNEKYSAELLQDIFADLQGKPVNKKAIEAALLSLSDYPGLSLFGVFQPGQTVGAADIILKVQEEKRFDISVRHDNHGQKTTGERRTRLDFAWNNPTDGGDRLKFVLQQTQIPSNSFFQLVEYERPIIAPGYLFHLDYNKNAFDVGREFKDRLIFSDTIKGKISLSKSFIRSREKNLTGEVAIHRKTSRTKVRGSEISKDSLSVLDLNLVFDSVDSEFAGLNSAYLQVSHGFNDLFGSMGGQGSANDASIKASRRGANQNYATGAFDKLFFAYSRLQSFTPISEKLRHHSLLFRSEMQWSPDMLVPLEQYSIGGPNSVRAYGPAEELFDKAYFLSLEYIVNAPGFADKPAFGNYTWGELLQFSLFFDTAAGKKINAIVANEVDSRNYNGYGWSLSFNNPGKFSTRVTVGYPVGTPKASNDRHTQFWMDLNYTF